MELNWRLLKCGVSKDKVFGFFYFLFSFSERRLNGAWTSTPKPKEVQYSPLNYAIANLAWYNTVLQNNIIYYYSHFSIKVGRPANQHRMKAEECWCLVPSFVAATWFESSSLDERSSSTSPSSGPTRSSRRRFLSSPRHSLLALCFLLHGSAKNLFSAWWVSSTFSLRRWL